MTDEIVKPEVKRNRGGRPPVPSPPQNADEVRRLIATEVCRSKPREMMLRGLFRLLSEYKQHEKSPLELRKIEIQEAVNRDKAAELELKRQAQNLRSAEYRRRFAGMPHGQQKLLKSLERLEKENADLKRELGTALEGRAA